MHRVHLLPLLSCAAALQAPWFVKTETFKQSLSFPQIRPHLEAHKAWVAGLRADGHSITSGYRVDADGAPGGGGLMLFAAEDYAAAEQLVLCDPLVANGCVDWQLNQWVADVGDIALVDGGAWYAKQAAPKKPPPKEAPAESDGDVVLVDQSQSRAPIETYGITKGGIPSPSPSPSPSPGPGPGPNPNPKPKPNPDHGRWRWWRERSARW